MITILIILLIVLALINIFLTLKKGENIRDEELEERLIKMDTDLSRMDPLIRDEFSRSREENLRAAKENRAEQRLSLKSFENSFMRHVKDFNSF